MSASAIQKLEEFANENGILPTVPAGNERGLEAYYDGVKKEFVMQNEAGRWLSHPSRQFSMLLRTKGFAGSTLAAERIMAEIIDNRDVAYTGQLAGRPAGFYNENGVRMLVTQGPRLITPRAGEWPTIHSLVSGLLGSDANHAEVQVRTFECWLRSAFESVATGKWRPGHILALAGPIGCGKSLLQRLITECIGGRSADAFRYLSGKTEFNRELFGCEHLVVDDAQASTDYRARMQMAAHLKSIAVGRDHSCHGKGRDAVNLRPLWRCSISLNDEGECLLVLPPLRADIADKIHILRCASPREAFPTDTPEAMADYWTQLISELPAYLHHCTAAEPLEGRTDARFGHRAFHNPGLVLELESQAPEIVLLELIDHELWRSPQTTQWEGTARELESLLLQSSVREQTRTLLKWTNACGTFLGRLAKTCDRVEEDREPTRRGWIIKRPKE